MDIIRNKKEAPHARVCMMEFVATALSEVSQSLQTYDVCQLVCESVHHFVRVGACLFISQSLSQIEHRINQVTFHSQSVFRY